MGTVRSIEPITVFALGIHFRGDSQESTTQKGRILAIMLILKVSKVRE